MVADTLIKGGLGIDKITQLLGEDSDYLLNFDNPRIPGEMLYVPGPLFIDEVYGESNRNNKELHVLTKK